MVPRPRARGRCCAGLGRVVDANPPVIVRLMGGLGNQLFQYAAGVAAAERLGGVPSFVGSDGDLRTLSEMLSVELRPATLKHRRQVGLERLSVQRRLVRRVQRRLSLGTRPVIIRQPAGPSAWHSATDWSKEVIGPRTSTVYLDGYFQHPSWSYATKDDVAKRLRRHLLAQPAAGAVAGSTVVSFRRGDYVRVGWDLPLSYYAAALDRLPRNDLPVWVVGDDSLVSHLIVGWLGDRGFAASSADELPGSPMDRDMCMLADAEQVVMSNSTFCWWGVTAGGSSAARSITAPNPWVPLPGSSALLDPSWIAIHT
jgi:hypothetical protein